MISAPEESVVPDLGGAVEYATAGFLDDVLETTVLELRPLDQIVQVGDVGVVMLPVVKLQSLLGDVRSQCIDGVGKRWKLVLHVSNLRSYPCEGATHTVECLALSLLAVSTLYHWPDQKFSRALLQSFSYWKKKVGLPTEVDAHSLRRTAITILERAGASRAQLRATALLLRYSPAIEEQLERLAGGV